MDTSQIGLPPNVIAHKIGEDVYHIKLLPAEQCWEAVEDSLEFVAPILGTWYDSSEGLGEDMGVQIGALISQNLKGLNIVNWAKRFLTEATKNGQKVNVTDFFGAKGLKTLKELTLVAYKENCLDFLTGELDAMGLKIPSKEEFQLNTTQPE